MKNALILHGTAGSSQVNWIPWLKRQLEEQGWRVWAPDLPDAEHPNMKKYNKFIFSDKSWKFDKDSIIIGHSSGAVEILGLLQSFPKGAVIDRAFLIGSFKNDLGWENLKGLFEEPLNFKEIKKHARKFIFLHSDDDPYCPLEHAKYLSQKLGGELRIEKSQKHFSVETGGMKFLKLPVLIDLIQETESR